MPTYRVPTMLDSVSLTAEPHGRAFTGLPKTYIMSVVVFFFGRRMEYRPKLWPAMKATDLRIGVCKVILDAFPGLKDTVVDFDDAFRQDPDLDVLLHLQNPETWFLRTLADVETDSDLWERILNFEFPHRHISLKQWEGARGKKRRFDDGEEIEESPMPRRSCLEKMTGQIKEMEVDGPAVAMVQRRTV
jgi:hypothetical protein